MVELSRDFLCRRAGVAADAAVGRRQALLWLSLLGAGPLIGSARGASRLGAVPDPLRRGFNLPDQVPPRAGRAPDDRTLARLRRIGMTHVRLPIEAEFFLSRFSGAATIAKSHDDLERALERLVGAGYCVSVDMHPGADFQRLQRHDPEAAHAALTSGWRALAPRLAGWPSRLVVAELLNEPATSDDIWRAAAERLAREVRERLPETTIVVGAAPYQRPEALARWRAFADRNIVYAVHFYDPMIFTHQGAEWDADGPFARLEGVPFPFEAGDPAIARRLELAQRRGDAPAADELRKALRENWTLASISQRLAALRRWSEANAAPVIVNEFGVLRAKAGRSDRLAWLRAVRVAAEASGFGWAHWDYAGGFGLLDEGGRLDAGVVGALFEG